MRNDSKLITLVAAVTLSGLGCADQSTQADAARLSEARDAAKNAYIFTYPLVMNYRTMYRQAIDGEGEFGKWLHLGLSSPADTDIVTPNNDTPYSYAWLDLRAEPWVLTLPEIEPERFYTSQWDDLWGYVLDNPGSINDGNSGLSVVLASPSWVGDLPDGADRVIRGESDFLGTLTRTQVIGGENDLPRVEEIQRSYQLQTLSEYMGGQAAVPAAAIDWPAWTEGDEATERYWHYLAFMLPFTTPHPDDTAAYEQMRSIGLVRGEAWDPETLEPAVRKAIQEGVDAARAELKKRSEGAIDPSTFFGSRDQVGTDYVSRALGVYVGIFGNVAQQSVYLSVPTDADGNLLDGSRASYTLTFAPDDFPPVDYFWSITMYQLPERLLVENPIQRYSIGSSTPGLNKNDDGSLAIYVSAESPGSDKESNWLPAPEGPFWTVLRCYGPGEEIINGTYVGPDYVATKRE